MFALIPIICEQPLILCQICQKSEASHLTQSAVILSRSRTIFRRKRSRRSIPVEIAAVLEFADQPRGIETVPRLPELQDDKHDHEDVILDMMAAFEQPFHGFQFGIPEEGYYETQDGLSWGVNPTHTHDRNQGGSEIMLQIGRRETPHCQQSGARRSNKVISGSSRLCRPN